MIIPESSIRYKIGIDSWLPDRIALSQNYPNPFNAQTVIEYSLPEQSQVTMGIYDLLGDRIAVLAEGIKPAGAHQVSWNAGNYPSGIYFYSIRAGDFSETKKMLLLK